MCIFMWLPVGNLQANSSCWGCLCLLTTSSGNHQHGGLWPLLSFSQVEVCNAGCLKGSGSGKQMVETALITTSQRIALTVQEVMVLFSLNVTMCLLLQVDGLMAPPQCWSTKDDRRGITVLLSWTWCLLSCFANNVSCKSAREISGIWETTHFWEKLIILSVFSWNVAFYLEGKTP